jgi:hypothetical protein
VHWSVHNAGIRGVDLMDALVREWADPWQLPQPTTYGLSLPLLPNPRYDPDAPARLAEHLVLAGRGVAPEEDGWLEQPGWQADQPVQRPPQFVESGRGRRLLLPARPRCGCDRSVHTPIMPRGRGREPDLQYGNPPCDEAGSQTAAGEAAPSEAVSPSAR